MKKIAFYAGSFDPFTKGHLAVVCDALCRFDTVIIGVGVNQLKETLFSVGERKALIFSSIEDLKLLTEHRDFSGIRLSVSERNAVRRMINEPDCLQVVVFNDLTVDAALRCGATTLIRGVRNDEDKAAEKKLAVINEQLLAVRYRKLEQEQICASDLRSELENVSSSAVKSLFEVGEYVAAMNYVMPSVHNAMSRHYLKERYCASFNGKLSGSWKALDKAYLTARKYHTMSHLAYCLNYAQIFQKISATNGLSKVDKACWDMAIFWHDFYCGIDNAEEKSADAIEACFKKTFRGYTFPLEFENLNGINNNLRHKRRDLFSAIRVKELILATKHDVNSEPTDQLCKLIHDVDLAILGDDANYGTYAMQIRLENAECPTKKYAKARIKVLESLLKKKRLFWTDFFYDMFEERARTNLCHEIAFWQKGY